MSQLSDQETQQIHEKKAIQRREAYDARNAQPEKDALSREAVGRLLALDSYHNADTVMWYIDCRSELRTQWVLPTVLDSGKRIVVPYCTVDEQGANKLGLWWLEELEELVVGKWKILEPPRDRWDDPNKLISTDELDLVVVPGVGFSREGARMGNGQGYYDRLLDQVRADCSLVGLCYESQLFEELSMGPHDVYLDYVVTEQAVYDGRGRN